MAEQHLAQGAARKMDPELLKTLVAVAMFGSVCCFLYWKYLWKPFSVRIEAAETKIVKVNSDIALAIGTAKRLEKITEEIASLKQQQEAAEKRLPRSKDIPGLIRSVVADSRRYKVFISAIAPGPTVNKTYFSETSWEIKGTAVYKDLGSFLSAVSASTRIFNIKNLTVTKGAEGNVTFSFTLVAFAYKG